MFQRKEKWGLLSSKVHKTRDSCHHPSSKWSIHLDQKARMLSLIIKSCCPHTTQKNMRSESPHLCFSSWVSMQQSSWESCYKITITHHSKFLNILNFQSTRAYRNHNHSHVLGQDHAIRTSTSLLRIQMSRLQSTWAANLSLFSAKNANQTALYRHVATNLSKN